MSEWQDFFVEDIAAPGKNSLATGPFGSSISSKFFVEQGVPVIRGGNLSAEVGKRLDDEGLVFVSKDKAEEFSRSVVGVGDLIFTCWGTINQVGLIDSRASHPNYVIS
ncbi:TPA: restriction endonuclease subunit S, partial [Pseudomonas aeruginosa]|nr:restriction endonuclease subunit S [Pseudomonas aeruginosa]